jgi:hypothetical protein
MLSSSSRNRSSGGSLVDNRSLSLRSSRVSHSRTDPFLSTWVEPMFFADVEYRDITSEGLLRASSFKGLLGSSLGERAIRPFS